MAGRTTAVAVVAALAVGAGGGYAGGAWDEAAAAKTPQAQSDMSGYSMMGGHDGSMMDAQHAKMMRDPDVRAMHKTMAREHAKTMRDAEMRSRHDRAMRKFPEMARMMREHMES